MFTQRDLSARIIAASVAAFVGCGALTPAQGQTIRMRTGAANSAARAAQVAHPASATNVVYSFSGPDGANPQGGLVLTPDGKSTAIFGANQSGGTANDGTLFKFEPADNTVTTKFTFTGANGMTPSGGLAGSFGDYSFSQIFTGVTEYGGTAGLGAIYAATGNGAQTVIYSFKGGADGANPVGRLVQFKGSYYGTTSAGALGYGTVFRYTPGSGVTTLHTFTGGNDGGTPLAGLAIKVTLPSGAVAKRSMALTGKVVDAQKAPESLIASSLYGVTSTGGNGGLGAGTIFSIKPDGRFKTLYTFADNTAAPGASPEAELSTDLYGNLFGTTYTGGSAGVGEVFEYAANGTVSVIHDFGADPATGNFTTGANPLAPLTVFYDDTIFGTASSGSANGLGNVFEIVPGSGFVLRHEFAGPDGAGPQGKLVDALNGSLYGTTFYGGASGAGTIFAVPEQQ